MTAGLRGLGIDSIVITRRLSADVLREEFIDGTKVYRIGPVGSGASRKWGMLATAFAALVRHRREYDVVYVPGFRVIGLAAVVAGKLFRKRLVFRAVSRGEMSGAFFESGLARVPRPLRFVFGLFSKLRAAVLKRADCFVSISSPMKDELLACGVPEDSIVQIPNGIDPDLYRPADEDVRSGLRQTLKVPEDAFVGVYTGRLVRYKGLIPLIRGFAPFADEDRNAVLVLVGDGSNDIHNCQQELEELVAELGLEDSVKFAGAVDNVVDYLRMSDCFLFPTEDEAFGISLIEAMACGLPVISTDIGGIADYLQDGENGLVIETGDPEGISRALERLYTRPQLREQLGERARAMVVERFSQGAVDRQYEYLFCDIAGGGA